MAAEIKLIAAVGKRGQLGLGGTMPWLDKEDLKWFRGMTLGHVVVIGSKTAATTKAWPDREKHVMARTETVEDVIQRYRDRPVIWVGGGAIIYSLWAPYVRRSFITHIDYDGPADVWMPPVWGHP